MVAVVVGCAGAVVEGCCPWRKMILRRWRVAWLRFSSLVAWKTSRDDGQLLWHRLDSTTHPGSFLVEGGWM